MATIGSAVGLDAVDVVVTDGTLAAGVSCAATSGSARTASDKERRVRFIKVQILQSESDDAVRNRVTGGGHSGVYQL